MAIKSDFIGFVFFCIVGGSIATAGNDLKTLSFQSIDSEARTLKDYAGKVVLIVNIATKCGYTPQLKGLEALYQKYKGKGLVVLGVPSNDFGEQTPESNPKVKSFCRLNYGVSFPLSAKMSVRGKDQHPLFKGLTRSGADQKPIQWNFEKFLLNQNGELVERFPSNVKPLDANLDGKIKGLLDKTPKA